MDQFYVELDRLDNLGNTRLPAIAESIVTSHDRLKDAIGWITRTFETRGDSTGDQPWQAEQPYEYYLFWRAGNECYYAMDFMRRIFEDNHQNVDLAAQAIREIALRYRQADGQA